MRYRLVGWTGLGNGDAIQLNNSGMIDEKVAKLAILTYFDKWGGFDFQVEELRVKMGIEPSYQNDPMLIITIDKDKEKSTITRGRAFGGYGTQVVSKTKTYKGYKRKSKFIRFVDESHAILFGVL